MIFIIITLTIIFLDQITKNIINKKIKTGENKEIIKNYFYLTNIKNQGAFYGLFKDKSKQLLYFNTISVFVLSIIFIFTIKSKKDNLLKLIISFIIGGAVGNIIDRVKRGTVTDFIYIKFKKAPIFNIADLFLFLTPLLALIRIFRKSN